MLPHLEAGRNLNTPVLRTAMTAAFGADDAHGAWIWKDVYEAAETALVLFLHRYGQSMRKHAGSVSAMLAMLETLAALEPSQTRRSQQQTAFQQFSTPLPLAYTVIQAAALQPGDRILEPSAGTGMLAIMAACSLRKSGTLHLNELAETRAALLHSLFPNCSLTRHNAEAIRDHLHSLTPTVVIMNPPFSVSPGVATTRHHADLRHVRSAFSMLAPGGRLVAITSRNCIPNSTDWHRAFGDISPQIAFTAAIDGHAYARRGTSFDTRLTVLDNTIKTPASFDPSLCVADAGALLDTCRFSPK